MTSGLFPRLDVLSVDQCLGNLDRLIEQAASPISESRLPASTRRSAVGGTQITMSALGELRKLLVDIASACGFPERGSTADRARFDAQATRALAECEHFAAGEADRDDVWAFIATVLLPDVVAWRFSGRSSERFHGGVRNTFQRLWMRAWALDRGPDSGAERWKLVEMLTEDALVQLTERPSIGADRQFSLAIANAWVETADRIGRPRMEDIMRLAIIELRIRSEIQFLSMLEQDALQRHVSAIFARAAGLEPPDIDGPSTSAASAAAPAAIHPHDPGTDTSTLDPSESAASNVAETKVGEHRIQLAILRLMLDGNEWTNAQLKERLAGILPFTEADRGRGARTGEELWENRVNNALGRARTNSLYAKGLVESCGHGVHRITESGADYIRSEPA